MDLDAWINDPPSESEDESTATNARGGAFSEKTSGLFYGDTSGDNYYHGSNLDSHTGGSSAYQKPKSYVEPTPEELEKQRESRKQSQKMNPFYLKDSSKTPLKVDID